MLIIEHGWYLKCRCCVSWCLFYQENLKELVCSVIKAKCVRALHFEYSYSTLTGIIAGQDTLISADDDVVTYLFYKLHHFGGETTIVKASIIVV